MGAMAVELLLAGKYNRMAYAMGNVGDYCLRKDSKDRHGQRSRNHKEQALRIGGNKRDPSKESGIKIG